MNGFVDFMNGVWGRLIRIALGVALIGYGLFGLGDTLGLIIAVIGVVPLGMGLWGHCLPELVIHREGHA